MKNTLKYIATFVAIVSGFAAYAQNLDQGKYLVDNGIAYAKRAIVNDDGTYTIDLETFVTGEVTQTFESVPVDVVLVLDVSGSMDEAISTVSSYDPASVSSLTYSNNQGQTDYYYNYNGNYYRVSVGRQSSGGWGWGPQTYYYYLSFSTGGWGGTTYYINTSGEVVTNRPSNVTSQDTNLLNSNVQLYTLTTTTTTKMDALQSAVEAFINEIAHNDLYEDDTDDNPRSEALGNKIAIVKFSSIDGYGYTYSYYNNDSNAYIHADGGNHTETVPTSISSTGIVNYTEVVRGLTDVETGSADLISAVNGLKPGGATAADYGMQLAFNIIDHIDSDRNSNKTVVFFTDGEPNHYNGFNTTVASNAIQKSNDIKGITYGSGDDATHPVVYSVGVFSGTVTDQIRNFMTNVASSSNHFMNASGGTAEDLKDIFTAIAHSAGGSGNTQVSGGSSLTVDVVSSSFSVPKGYEENPGGAIEVLVAPVISKTSIDNEEYLVFGAEKAPSEYGLPDITPSISESDNKVSTTGFDYSENWCGPDPTSPSGYHGYKQIIRFIISVNDDAVGGPAVQTNNADSGIYLEGSSTPLITFNRPTVKLPVQIWLQKQGLRPGDSAVFTLYMSPFVGFDTSDPENNDWSNFTKVVVNYEDMDENGLVKIVGLDPDFFYKLKEDAWAFGYTYQNDGIQYTVGDNIENPFVFINDPNPIKYDEASARNIFNEKTASSSGSEGGDEGGEGGDEGKKRGR